MKPFSYHRASDLFDAASNVVMHGGTFLAGGQTLIRDLKRGLLHHAHLTDIGPILGREIQEEPDAIMIEAGATHAAVAASPIVRARLPMLSALVEHIADPAVRNRATIGGAIAANEAAGDYMPAVLALGAAILTTRRWLSASDAAGAVSLAEGEIITLISFPIPRRAGYAKILHPAARYAMVGACAVTGRSGKRRLAITGASTAGPFRWTEAERALKAHGHPGALDQVPLPPISWREDPFADAEYRAHLVRVMARRAVIASLSTDPVAVFSHGARIPDGTISATRSTDRSISG